MPTRPSTRELAGLGKAATLLRMPAADVLRLLTERALYDAEHGQTQPWHIPLPVGHHRKKPVWDFARLRHWGLTMGYTAWAGKRVIGYLGLARMCDVDPQSLRTRTTVRNNNIRLNGHPDRLDIPAPVVTSRVWGAVDLVLFDFQQAHQWAVHSGRVALDGTPTRLKPRRTAA